MPSTPKKLILQMAADCCSVVVYILVMLLRRFLLQKLHHPATQHLHSISQSIAQFPLTKRHVSLHQPLLPPNNIATNFTTKTSLMPDSVQLAAANGSL
jgi:hypothetical protein